MHPAQGAFFLVEGDVCLCDERFEAVVCEFLLAESPREESPVVFPPFDVENEGAFELCFPEDHSPLLQINLSASWHRST
jgi:hypothetical protein